MERSNKWEDAVLKIHEQTFDQRFHQLDLPTLQQMKRDIEQEYGYYTNFQQAAVASVTSSSKEKVQLLQASVRNTQWKYSAALSRIGTKILQLTEPEPPIFSGEQRDWKDWWSQFKEFVQNHTHFSEEQKLNVLRASIPSADRAVLAGENGFYEAMQMLVKHHEGKYAATMMLFDELDSTEKCTDETYDNLIELVLITNRFVREFRTLGSPTTAWDHLFLHFLKERMPANTYLAWIRARSNYDMPTLTQALDFLRQRAESIKQALQQEPIEQIEHVQPDETCQESKPENNLEQRPIRGCRNAPSIMKESQDRMRRNAQAQDVHQNRTICQHGVSFVKCYHCAGPHPMALCDAFKSLGLMTRIDRVQELRLCRNCFSNSHQAESMSCKAHPCRICAGQQLSQRWHNTLLCANRPVNDNQKELEEEGAASLAYQRSQRRTQ